ncbi:MAG TPA: phage regulatory CII family protein [Noviherbaspirillum sp.]|jgi:hypothetical protein|uniref:phage regulatory CII family protein n=1 Tax=Noviherbaspirillum sp. TaxID=1926288 RepID=UPI002F959292
MNLLDAFFNTVHDYPGGTESLAPRMGMSAAILRNKADQSKDHNKPLLVDADKIMAITGDYRILDALAAAHGRVCIEVPADRDSSDMAVLELVTKVWQSNGDVGTSVHETLADGKVEKKELARVRAAIYRQQKALNEMLMRLEGMSEK